MTDSKGIENRAERLDGYRLLELLGEGGMGEVWLAEQLEPVRREVAIKIVKLGMDTRDIVARFEAERQALAIMDDPRIARVLGGGITPDGRPYFVMERVRGVSITEYCDTERADTAARLRMMADVCRAVQHAHQKGLIHRDLKPSNILVTSTPDGPAVKVIDFGIAKAIGGGRLTDKTLHTRVGQTLGTPSYMSPEQADGNGLDTDTRSDIYSLGIVLYELLVGVLPFEPPPNVPLDLFMREHDAVRPSMRVKTLNTRSTVAKFRSTNPDQLQRQLRGDIDWIILRAVEKDRARRYDTANAFALDIERYLKHEPISARPPSTGYRFSKFARRHRPAVAAGIVALLALVAGTTAATAGFVRARNSERRAIEEGAAARQISDFLVGLFAVNEPSQARGNTITAREVLDRGADRVRTELREQPQVRARLMATIGRVYSSIGLFDSAEPLMREAVTATKESGASPERQAVVLTDLGFVLKSRGKLPQADSSLRLALSLAPPRGDSTDWVAANVLSQLADVLLSAGAVAGADSAVRAAIAIKERIHGRDSRQVAKSLAILAYLHDDEPETSEPILRRAYDIELRERGPDDPGVINMGNTLGLMWWGMGRYDEAEKLLIGVVANGKRILGDTHPQVAWALVNIGLVRLDAGRPQSAIAPLDEGARILATSRGSPATLALTNQLLARAFLATGDPMRAQRLAASSLKTLEASVGPRHNWTSQARTTLAEAYATLRRPAEAERLLRQAVADQSKAFGPNHRQVVAPLIALARLVASQSREAEADSLFRSVAAVAEKGFGPHHPATGLVKREAESRFRGR